MALDSAINRSLLISIFPDLANDNNFKILSECTPVYNCIAWAMGYNDRWVSPFLYPGYWWPDGVVRSMAPEALIQAFQVEGFEMSDDILLEDGYSKVVLYKNLAGDQWTHAARIVTDDTEYSKFGQSFDGQHSHEVLCRTSAGCSDQSYGTAFAYMKRLDSKKESPAIPQGSISVNPANLAKLKALLGK